MQTAKGRIVIAEQLRRRYGRQFPIEVRYDEFTEDIVENRLLKAAIARLSRRRVRAAAIRLALLRLEHGFQRVAAVDYEPRRIPGVHFNPLNQHYAPALRLARLILESSMISLDHGETRASCLLVDMNQVFEDFVAHAQTR